MVANPDHKMKPYGVKHLCLVHKTAVKLLHRVANHSSLTCAVVHGGNKLTFSVESVESLSRGYFAQKLPRCNPSGCGVQQTFKENRTNVILAAIIL